MAIIKCPNCGGKISTTREECPHCGYDYKSDNICLECGAKIPKKAEECPVCGYILNSQVESIKIKESPKKTFNNKSYNVGDEEYKRLKKTAQAMAQKKTYLVKYACYNNIFFNSCLSCLLLC